LQKRVKPIFRVFSPAHFANKAITEFADFFSRRRWA
jgi:hypothetical protein